MNKAESLAIKTQSQWTALVGKRIPFNDNNIEDWTGKTRKGIPTIRPGGGVRQWIRHEDWELSNETAKRYR